MTTTARHSDEEYTTDIQGFLREIDRQRPWYDIDWRSKLTLKNAYIAVSIISFIFLGAFGCVFLVPYDTCLVARGGGVRCCYCLTDAVSSDNPMPQKWVLNGVYYGLAIVVNAIIGISYVLISVRSENQYQMLIMLVTQMLICSRGILDSVLDTPETDLQQTQRSIAIGFLAVAVTLLLVSCALFTPVYRTFGWASFKRAGARRSILQMYKLYQRFRALNRLDMQSSFILFFVLLVYIGQTANQGAWVFVVLLVCDVLASRFMVKYLKQEDLMGTYISIAAKSFVVCWWGVLLNDYFACFQRYNASRDQVSVWFTAAQPLQPSLQSVAESMGGTRCLAPYTAQDSRTFELMIFSVTQAVFFRFSSIVVAIFIIRNFGKGLKEALYSIDEASAAASAGATAVTTADDDEATKMQFVPKKVIKVVAEEGAATPIPEPDPESLATNYAQM